MIEDSNRLSKFNLKHNLTPNTEKGNKPIMTENIWITFLGKSLIVGTIAALVGSYLISPVADRIERITWKVEAVMRQVEVVMNLSPGGGGLSAAGERLASNLKTISTQRRKELITSLREIVLELRPFADELRPLFVDTSPDSSHGKP